MTVDRDDKGQLYYQYNTSKDDAPTMKGSMVNLKPSDVLHIPGLGFDGLVGYSPIAMAKNAIGMAIACEEYGAKFFANGATPGGILEHPGTVKDPQRVRESWTSAFGGSSNANKVAVLEEGMKYTPISISPKQAQFLENRKFQINEIARIFRVPPHMVGDLEKSSFSNIEQQSLEFVKYTLDPGVARWEQAIVRSLFSADIAVATTKAAGEFEEMVVPKSTWAVFYEEGPVIKMQELVTKIVTQWLPTSGYEYAEAPEIELYLNPDPDKTKYEIWLPIVRKGRTL